MRQENALRVTYPRGVWVLPPPPYRAPPPNSTGVRRIWGRLGDGDGNALWVTSPQGGGGGQRTLSRTHGRERTRKRPAPLWGKSAGRFWVFRIRIPYPSNNANPRRLPGFAGQRLLV